MLVSFGCKRCVEYIGNFLPTFRDNLSALSLRVKNGFLTLEAGTDRLFRKLVTQKNPVLLCFVAEA
jgi:hypothetical protein